MYMCGVCKYIYMCKRISRFFIWIIVLVFWLLFVIWLYRLRRRLPN